MALTGNLDVPGGNILVRNAFEINAGYATGEEFVPPESMANRLTASKTWEPKSADIVAAADSDALTYALETGKPYPIKMLWFQSSNTLSCPGMAAPRLYKAMQNVEFVVNCDRGSSEEYWSMDESLNHPSSVKDDCPMGCKLLL